MKKTLLFVWAIAYLSVTYAADLAPTIQDAQYQISKAVITNSCESGFDLLSGSRSFSQQEISGPLPYIRSYSNPLLPDKEGTIDFYNKLGGYGGWSDNYTNYLIYRGTSTSGKKMFSLRLPDESKRTFFFEYLEGGVYKYQRIASTATRIDNVPMPDSVTLMSNLGPYSFKKVNGLMVVNKNGVDYTFNSAGRVSKIDNQPSGQIIKYTYVNNQISRINDNRNNELVFTYDPANGAYLKIVQYQNGVEGQSVIYDGFMESTESYLGGSYTHPVISKITSTLTGITEFEYQSGFHPLVRKAIFDELGTIPEAEKQKIYTATFLSFMQTVKRNGNSVIFVNSQNFGDEFEINAITSINNKMKVRYSSKNDQGLINVTHDLEGAQQTYSFTTSGKDQFSTTTASGSFPCMTVNNLPISQIVTDNWNGLTLSSTDKKGVLTSYSYDLRNRVTKIEEAVGTPAYRATSYTYGSLSDGSANLFTIPTKVVSPNLEVNNIVHPLGVITKQTISSPLSGSISQTTNYTYNTDASLANYKTLKSIDGPRTDVADLIWYEYDSNAQLTKQTQRVQKLNPSSTKDYVKTYSDYTPAGLPRQEKDFNGLDTVTVYDASGVRVLSNTIGNKNSSGVITNGRMTSNTYDSLGQLLTVKDPLNAITTFYYDIAGRKTKESLPDGSSKLYFYATNDELKTTQYYNSAGVLDYQESAVLDQNGRIKTRYRGTNQAISMTYEYDANGNVIKKTDQGNRIESFVYDELNRLKSHTNKLGYVDTQNFDASDNLVSKKAPNNSGSTSSFVNTNKVSNESNTDYLVKSFTYDSANNIIKTVNSNRICDFSNYDSLNRISKQSCYLSDNTTEEYLRAAYSYVYDQDVFGNLNQVIYPYSDWTTKPLGVDSFYSYNAYGEIVDKSQTVHKAAATGSTNAIAKVRYEYDQSGRVIKLTTPKGNIVEYIYNGVTSSLTDVKFNGQTLISSIVHNAQGEIIGWKWSNGATYSISNDTAGRVSAISVNGFTPNVNLVYTYQSAKADLINTITDTVSGIKQTFTYDNEDQLTDYVVSGGSRNGLKTSYSYDSNGNRISSTNNLAGTYNYSFTLTTNSNKLNSWEKNNTSVPFTLHATGEVNTLSDMLTGNFKYDGEGNKRREMGVPCTHPTTGATTCNMWFDYNHKNERVFSYADNISEGRQFVYDENSHLIGEYRNSDQAQIVEYIWLGDIPIAAEMANDRLIYILTDHRGSPIRGYDAVTKANVWSLDTGPFGESAATVSVSGVEINLRFPGMYYDKQTGLYYNHHRYYNPKWGRYMEPDPIGLEGGLNPFVYSNNDPINKVDPSGLGWKQLKLIGSLFDDILAPLGREAIKRLSQNSSKEKSISENVKASSRIQENRAQGKAFEQKVGADLKSKNTNVSSEVTLKTKSGQRTRMDFLSKDQAGKVVCTECKSSVTAPLTKNQKAAFPEIERSGAVVVGKGKPDFPEGTIIPPTKIEIVRPK